MTRNGRVTIVQYKGKRAPHRDTHKPEWQE